MYMRMFDRAYTKTISCEEEFEYGPILNQDIALIYEKKLDYDPDFLYFIDYDFSCDVDVWGRVATTEVGVGSVIVNCKELGISGRVHDYEKLCKEEPSASFQFAKMIERDIEKKYEQGAHLD